MRYAWLFSFSYFADFTKKPASFPMRKEQPPDLVIIIITITDCSTYNQIGKRGIGAVANCIHKKAVTFLKK
jgi:hypothetical protein